MTQFARTAMRCQGAPFSKAELRLDVEVLADRYEVLAALSPLEDEPHVEINDTDEEALDDLPF